MIKIKVKAVSGLKFEIECDDSININELKKLCSEKYNNVPVRLIFKGHVLKDDQIINKSGIEDGSTVIIIKNVIKKKKKKTPQQTMTEPPQPTTMTEPHQPTTTTEPTTEYTPLSENLPEPFAFRLPDIQAAIENNPQIAEIFNNPEFIQQTSDMIRNSLQPTDSLPPE